MSDVAALVADNLDIWTGAMERKSSAGRGSSKKISLYGIDRLRTLILDLAVRGRLVPQNSSDEPASELLARIRLRKEQLIGEGIIKKSKSLNWAVIENEPFKAPQGWKFSSLGAVAEKLTDGSHNPPSDAGYGYPMLSSQNIFGGGIAIDAPSRWVSEEGFEKENARTNIQPNDVLLTIVASIGRSAVVPQNIGPFVLQRSVAVISTQLYPDFLSLSFQSPFCSDYMWLHAKGTAQKGIYLGKLSAMPLPVPPLAEQKRIVAKVDELLALCDELERESEGALAAHQTLVETLLATLTNSTDAADLATNWARIEAHFDTLFTTDSSVEALKHAILDLAVRGKLVVQDSGDDPVKLPSFRQVSVSSDWDEKVFEHGKSLFSPPKSWEIAPLAQVSSHIVDCPHTTPKWTEAGELCVRTNQIKPRHLDLSQPNYVSHATYLGRIARLEPAEGDILYIREGGILGVGCRIPDGAKLCLGQRSMLIRCHSVISSYYLEVAINSPFITKQAAHWTTGGAAPRINMSTVRGYPIPIPPLAEQKRIVAKVDGLMALCEQLKSRLADAAETQRHLADAITQKTAV